MPLNQQYSLEGKNINVGDANYTNHVHDGFQNKPATAEVLLACRQLLSLIIEISLQRTNLLVTVPFSSSH